MIELRTLGSLELISADGMPLDSVLTQPRRMALLCYLALASPRGFRRRDTLLALFWPEHDADQARHALRQSLYFLRRALGATAVVSRGDDELAVAPDHIRCDAVEFERAVDEGRLEDALALYQGELLPGFYVSDAPEFERWLDAERSRLRQRAAETAWALAEAREREGNPASAAEWAQRAADFSPGEETALRRLVVLLNRLGDRAAAVRAYEVFARDLEREYELPPSEETQALLARISVRQKEGEETARDSQRAPAPVERSSHIAVPSEPQAEVARADLGASRRRWSPVGARVASAALLALLGVAAWRLIARADSEPAPTVRERVLISDFTNLTPDSTFGDLIANILRSELAQSPLLGVVGPETIADALRRMRREPGTRLTADVARELAAREEIKVVVEGDVRPAGTALVITTAVIETASGDAIHGASETARDSAEILSAIERLSNAIRQGIGESLASIRASDSLNSFTTSSLSALRKHMAGSRAWWSGDYATAAELLEEATALDPEFAHAHLLLWTVLRNAGLPRGPVLRPLMRAYELRGRLTERERYAVEGHYHLHVAGDLPRAMTALRKHVEVMKRLPIGEAGWYGSLGNALALTGDLKEAEAVLRDARRRHPTPLNLTRLIGVLHAQGKNAEARSVLDELSRRYPKHPNVGTLRVALLADSGRYDDAHALAAQTRSDDVRAGLKLQAELDAVRGRVDEAVSHLRDLRDAMLTRADLASALEIEAAIGRLRFASGDSAAASEVGDLLARHPMDSLDVLSRPYLSLTLFYAATGQPHRARAWLDAYEREFPTQFRGPDQWMLLRARAATHRAEGNLAQALAGLREAARVPALRVGLFDDPSVRTGDHPELARVYDDLGAPDSAIAVYERYLAVRSLSRTATDAFELGTALERLGALYEKRGDRARAAGHYARLAALWRSADVRLRPRAEAAGRHAATLDAPARAQ
jgi:DNA-binding SARP family transcriptional activator/thioredoxin-like negative regulator of GroEL/TolB-like protein